ncbi:MAG: type IX secretion system membrane protein PorP/SprF, partial [Elusimicrobiota bacterium]|nr:type IX secretion system membrane protein PorP/SprF [Elusimicrobiota bacterium]
MVRQNYQILKEGKWLGVILLSTFLPFYLSTCLYTAFMDTGWGTRAGGMGNAFTAIANEPAATLWNPAGLSQLEMLETTFMYNKLFAGLDDVNLTQMFAAGALPTEIGAFGFTITDFALWGFYRENTISASYSRDLADDIGIGFPSMAGINLKYLTHSYTLDDRTKNMSDPVFDKTSAGGFTPDIGFLLKPSNFSFGLSALNILQPDVGLKTEDKVPMLLKFGTAYRIGDWKFFENITPTVDVSYRKPADTDADIKISGGVETWFNYNTWAARFGGNDRELSLGFSYNKMFKESGLQLDYAFLLPLQLADTSGSHRLSLTFRYSLSKKGRMVEGRRVERKEQEAKDAGMIIPAMPSPVRPPVADALASEVSEANKEKPKELTEQEKSALKKQRYDAAFKHYQNGEYELAIAGWEEVLKIDPNHKESKNKIALAKQKLEGQRIED